MTERSVGLREHGPSGAEVRGDALRLAEDIGPIGGQALVEGVMMRRAGTWGAAVRRTDGTIATTVATLPHDGEGVRRIPLVRGPVALWESVSLGTKAMLWGAKERGTADSEGYSRAGMALTTVIAATLAVTFLLVIPAAVPHLLGIDGRWAFNAAETALKLGVLVGYMALLSLNTEVRRTFSYHGAEHMTIHAFEHGVDLEPAEIRRFDRRHPRCGTAFLLIVVLVSLAVHLGIGDVSLPILIATRVLGLPVIAGLAYEIIRFAGLHRHTLVGRVLMAPGGWLQTLTTRPPDDDQIEVAVTALRATLTEAVPAGATGSPERAVAGAGA